MKEHERRRANLRMYGRAYERRVTRVDDSPMNPRVKVVRLDCGHDTYRQRRPRIGATVVCEECSRKGI